MLHLPLLMIFRQYVVQFRKRPALGPRIAGAADCPPQASAAMSFGVGVLHGDWVAPDRRVMLGLEIHWSVEVDVKQK